MARRTKHTPEQVVNLLRQIEVAVANGKTTTLACKEAEITEHSSSIFGAGNVTAANRRGTCPHFEGLPAALRDRRMGAVDVQPAQL